MIKISEAPQFMFTMSDIDHLSEAINGHVKKHVIDAYQMGMLFARSTRDDGGLKMMPMKATQFDAKAVLHNLLGVE